MKILRKNPGKKWKLMEIHNFARNNFWQKMGINGKSTFLPVIISGKKWKLMENPQF